MVADEAFPLRETTLKPYPHRSLDVDKRIFNYRLSRASRVVKNSFGILANRFCIFLTQITIPPATVEKIVLAACSLHKLLGTEAGTAYVGALADREGPETCEVTPGINTLSSGANNWGSRVTFVCILFDIYVSK